MTRRLVPALVLLALVASACGPKRDVVAGIKEGTTDIVYGGPPTTLPPTPPPLPTASVAPAFPTLVAAPPPLPAFTPMPPEPVIVPDPCPATPADAAAIPAPPRIEGAPDAGAYLYDTESAYKTGAAADKIDTVVAKTAAVRKRHVVVRAPSPDLEFTVSQADAATIRIATYRTFRETGSSATDGLYLSHLMAATATNTRVDEFAPVSPGLLMFPEPAQVGTTWRSVATDPIRATAMIIEGTVTGKQSVDVCGPRVEVFVLKATITVRRAGAPANAKDFVETATYLVAPQYGGLVMADESVVTGNDGGTYFTNTSKARLLNLVPEAPTPTG